MASIDVADATVTTTGRRAYERPALIAGVLGLIGVVLLVFIQPDVTATNLDVAEIEASAPDSIKGDTGAAVAATPITPPTIGAYAAHATGRLEGSRSGGATSTNRDVQMQVRAVEGAPTDGTYIMLSAGLVQGRNIIGYKADGAYIIARDALGEDGCTFDTPLKRWASPMEVGATWTSSGTCTQTARRGGFTREANMTIESTVTGTKSVTIGAAKVDAFVVESSIRTIEKTRAGDNEALLNRVEREVMLFAPSIGLPVEATSNATVIQVVGTQEARQETTATIKLLTTQPGGAA